MLIRLPTGGKYRLNFDDKETETTRTMFFKVSLFITIIECTRTDKR